MQDSYPPGGSRRKKLGRSGPRSRTGCANCKQRRVRCDEVHPVCGHCTRLQLDCYYLPQAQRLQQQERAARNHYAGSRVTGESGLLRQAPSASHHVHTATTVMPPTQGVSALLSYLPEDTNMSSSVQAKNFFLNDLVDDQFTSWAGEWPCIFPDDSNPPNVGIHSSGHDSGDQDLLFNSPGANNANPSTREGPAPDREGRSHGMVGAWGDIPLSFPSLAESSLGSEKRREPLQQPQNHSSIPRSRHVDDDEILSSESQRAQLKQLFQKIAQPPAAVLIGGFKRWRRLQRYFHKMSEQSRAVNSALLCVAELLSMNETCGQGAHERNECMKRILGHHRAACSEIRMKLSKNNSGMKTRTREYMLAAVFLLAWFEVIHDQDANRGLFPGDLADAVIATETTWSRDSQELLSWLNTLDSKATHLGGDALLSQKALRIVSRYPTRITSATTLEVEDEARNVMADESDTESSESPALSALSTEQSQFQFENNGSRLSLSMGQVKQAMLNSLLQPALEWYLSSQSYCRRISSHNKHHCSRSTTEDEYQVILACKQIETELFELWHSRPTVISVKAEQLMQVVSSDVATRLEEIFNVYLASFWILFVYLHRVSWWNFPLSSTASRALGETWNSMQRAYGEVSEQTQQKVVHPALLWPLFMFGCECKDESQRTWAIEQLEALSEAKPVLEDEESDSQSLPPFKLSSGATRNAKRAAILLRELIKQQDELKVRVDDRDLSMKMFNCYFSIV